MSIKIYDAYQYKNDVSTLLNYLIEYRNIWQEYQIERLSTIFHANKDKFFENEKLSYNKIFDTIRKDFEKKYFAEFDISSSVVVYFHKKNIYIQLFITTYDKKCPKFVNEDMVDFHYQNQADPWYDYCDDMSKSEKAKHARAYTRRKKIWNEIFHDYVYSPSQAGMIYDFCNEIDLHHIALKIYQNCMEKV